MNVDRNIKVPALILSNPLLSKADIGLKRFFAKKAQFLNFVILKMGVALHFSLQLANHKSQRSDLVLYARQITCLSYFIMAG